MAEQVRHAKGTKVAGASTGGQYAAKRRSEAAAGALTESVAMRYTSPATETVEAARKRLSETIPGYAEALDSPAGSYPAEAARTAALWAAEGEPDDVVQQVFDHDRMHSHMYDLGSPAPKRRKCTRCYGEIEVGTGRKTQYMGKTYGLCSSCAASEEFRPPMPNRTVDPWEKV